MRIIKKLLMVSAVLLSSNVLAQELKEWQENKLYEELEKMADVMLLNDQQIENLIQIKTDEILDCEKIMQSTTQGSKASKAAWKAHATLYWTLQKAAVMDDQWKKWGKYQKALRRSKEEGTYDYSQISRRAMAKVQKEVDSMDEIMSLTPEQKEIVLELKVALAKVSHKIYNTMEEGEERQNLWQTLNKDTNKRIRLATSSKQMQLWWEAEAAKASTKG